MTAATARQRFTEIAALDVCAAFRLSLVLDAVEAEIAASIAAEYSEADRRSDLSQAEADRLRREEEAASCAPSSN